MQTKYSITQATLGFSMLLLVGCSTEPLRPAAVATPTLGCPDLTAASLGLPGLTTVKAELVGMGAVTPPGAALPLPAHCKLTGALNERVSNVDGKPYAIGFELRLPFDWNGKFFFQGGGGNDGVIRDAFGSLSFAQGGSTSNALTQGYAVVSTDAGHKAEAAPIVGGALFGLDPQARLEYGYNAVSEVTTTSKSIIQRFYGKRPERSYFMGCSNGGRQAMIAAARLADQYDGVVAGNPGFNLPKAAIQHAWDSQAFAAVAPKTPEGKPIISQAFSPADMSLVASKVLEKCDALDGVADGMVNNAPACKAAFKLSELTCTGEKTAACLSAAQVSSLQKVFAGPRNSQGDALYADWPFDAGVGAFGWRIWKMGTAPAATPNSIIATMGGASLPYIFSTPPTALSGAGTTVIDYLLGYNFDTDARQVSASSGVYTQSPMAFMTPPNPTDLSAFKKRGGKMIVVHGNSDPVFSVNDTIRWYGELNAAQRGDAASFARLFTVPGMAHCSGGPSTDNYDALGSLVNWVEKGVAPDRIEASARAANADAKAWPTRTRPLCAHPKMAKYKGSGDVELSSSFVCG
jgi:pimeloyl-ACP methyl ester carboxylesterase